MDNCCICKQKSNKYRKPHKSLLKSIQKQKPHVTEDSKICESCYRRAHQQLKTYIEVYKMRRDTGKTSITVTNVESQQLNSTSASLDSIDVLVNMRSMRSSQKNRRAALMDKRRQSPVETRSRPSISGSREGSNSENTVATGRNESLQESDESSGNPLDPIPSSDNPLDPVISRDNLIDPIVSSDDPLDLIMSSEDPIGPILSAGNPLDPMESTSSQPLTAGVVVREYESEEEEEVEVFRQDDRLPGVQPYIKKRRTRVVFEDERSVAVYNSRIYGG